MVRPGCRVLDPVTRAMRTSSMTDEMRVVHPPLDVGFLQGVLREMERTGCLFEGGDSRRVVALTPSSIRFGETVLMSDTTGFFYSYAREGDDGGEVFYRVTADAVTRCRERP